MSEHFISIDEVKIHACALGFQGCGASKAEPLNMERFYEWTKKNYNAGMSYLNNYNDKRAEVQKLVPNAKTVFSFFISYNMNNNRNEGKYKIASYALGYDYHKVIKNKLYKLVKTIQERHPDFEARVFVDSAPVMEKTWAQKAGLGWIGKNSCFINRTFGSKILLGEIICNFTSDYASESKDLCGKCNKCINSCPNNAILPNRTIDSNKCIAYHTIENKGNIPESIRLDNYIYGCDICLENCIWNKKARIVHTEEFLQRKEITNLLSKAEKDSLEKSDFNRAKKHSALDRIKFDKLKSNIQSCNNNQNLIK